MTRRELIKDMQEYFERPMLSPKQIRQYTGWNKDLTRYLIVRSNAPNFGGEGRGQLYHVLDVADVIMGYRSDAVKKAARVAIREA